MKKLLFILLTLWMSVFTLQLSAQETVEIGTGTSTVSSVPFNSLYTYSFVEQIYTADEIEDAGGMAGLISTIRFYHKPSSTPPEAQTNTITLYMKNVDQTSFSSSSNYIPVSTADIVYQGSWTIPIQEGWVEIELDEPFQYDGSSNLMIAMHEYTPAWSSRYFTYTSTSNAVCSYYNDTYNPDPYNLSSYQGYTSAHSNRANIQLEISASGNFCSPPTTLTISNLSIDEATLSWTSSNPDANYDIFWTTIDTIVPNESTVPTDNTSNNSYSFSGLTSQTSYYVFVRSNCEGDETSRWKGTSFLTPQIPATVPYDQDFEEASENGNWGIFNGTYVNKWYIDTAANNTEGGEFALYVSKDTGRTNTYNISSTTNVWAYRDIDFGTAAEYQISFDWRDSTENCCDYLKVFVGAPQDVSTFGASTAPNGLTDISDKLNTSKTWTRDTFLLNSTFNGVQRLYLLWHNDGSAGTTQAAAVDNIHIESSMCGTPLAVTVREKTDETITIKIDPALASDELWDVVVMEHDSVLNEDLAIAISDTLYTIEGLTGNTVYDIYVRTACGSSWISRKNIRTDCSVVSIPYTDNFDRTGASSIMPYCWTRVPATATYPYTNTTNFTAPYSLYFNATSGNSNIAVMPEYDPSYTPQDLSVAFAMRASNTLYKLYIGVMDSLNTHSFEVVDSVKVTATDTWEEFDIDLSSYEGEGLYVAFKVTGHSSTESIYLDNVTLYPSSSCKRPARPTCSNITATSVTVNWAPNGEEENWGVVAVPAGTDPATGDVLSTSEHPYIIEHLEPNTQYDIYVQAVCGNNASIWSIATSCLTKCLPTDGLPYTENFDSYAGSGANSFPTCWTRHTDYTTNYPQISTSQHASGTKSLYFYADATHYSMAATQALDLSQANTDGLTLYFKLRKTTASYGRMDVGLMTNPDDLSTFTGIRSFYSTDYTTARWFDYVLPLPDYDYSQPVYIAFVAPAGASNYFYLDDVKIDEQPTCSAPKNLIVTSVAGQSALVSWDAAPFGVESYTLEYTEAGQDNWTPYITSETSYLLNGLTQGTSYEVMLYSNCNEGNADTLEASFNTQTYVECLQEDNVGTAIIGSDSTAQNYVPVGNYYHFCYTQQIYTADEINPAHTPTAITGIAFKYVYSSNTTKKNNVQIYLAHRSDSTFASTTDWTPITNATLVYEGNLNCTRGWNTFTFDQPFNYNGNDNLVVIVDDNSDQYDGSSCKFNTHTKTSSVLYYQSDSYNPDPTNPPTASYLVNNRNHIKLFLCDQIAPVSCIAPNVYNYTAESNQITLDWAAGSDEEAWELKFKQSNETEWSEPVNLDENSYTLQDLEPNTEYTIEIRSACGNNVYSEPVSLSVTTSCEDQTLPFDEDFDNAPTGSSAAFLDCWTRHTNYSTQYPYVKNIDNEIALYFYGSTSYYSYATLPRFADDILMDSLQILFDALKTSANYSVEVGIMTDPDDQTTFQLIATYSPSAVNEWKSAEVKTTGYTGEGHYVAFRIPSWYDSYMYVDNIHVNYIPNCLHVENIHTTDITTTTATITWTPGGEEGDWLYVSGEAGSINLATLTDDEWLPLITNSVELTDLTANTAYEIFVKAACDNGEISDVERYSFRTECEAISRLPYIENFDSWGNTTTSTAANPGPIPACWDRLYTATAPYPFCSSSYQWNGSSALYFYTSGTSSHAMAISPELDESINISDLQLSFMYRYYSYTCKLIVGVMSDPTDMESFYPVDTITASTTTWKKAEVKFNQYEGTGRYIALKNLPSSTYYFIVDNFVLDIAPTCDDPQDLSAGILGATSATITWEAPETENSWQMLVVPSTTANPDFTQAIEIDNAGGNSYEINDLSSNTSYTCWMRTVCSDGSGYSNWVSTDFRTLEKEPASVPYNHDFEDDEENDQYTLVNGSQTNKWYIGQPDDELDNVLFISNDGNTTAYDTNTAATVWAYRDLNFGESSEFNLSFSWKAYGESSSDYLKVYIGYPNTVTANSTTAPTNSIQLGGTMSLKSDWQRYNVTLMGCANTTLRLYFLWHNDGSRGRAPAAVIDSINIEIPNCLRPYSLTNSSISYNSAVMTIVPNQPTDTWEYALCAANGNPDTATAIPVGETNFTINDLEPNTTYDVYVRTVCDDGDSHSRWTSKVSITTPCSPEVAPYYENFNGFSTFSPCWKRYSGLAEDVFAGGELTSVTGYWNYSSSYVFTDGHMKLNIYGSSYKYWLVSPIIDLSALAEPVLTFSLALTDYGNANPIDYPTKQADDKFMVIISTDGGTTWSAANATVWDNTTAGDYSYNSISTTGEEVIIPLSQYAGNNIRIAFYGESTASDGDNDGDNDLHIDNLRVRDLESELIASDTALRFTTEVGSPVIQTTNISGMALSEDITVTSSSTLFEVSLNDTVYAASLTIPVSGLTINRNIYVRYNPTAEGTDNGTITLSSGSETFTITLNGEAIDCSTPHGLPYTEDFESYAGTTYNTPGIAPSCWVAYGNYSGVAPHITSTGDYHYTNSGTNCMVFTSNSSSPNAYAALPAFTSPLNSLKITFWRAMESATSGTLTVGYVTDRNNMASSFVEVETVPSISHSSATATDTFSVDFAAAANIPTDGYICFRWYKDGTYYSCCIDDIYVEESTAPIVEDPTVATYPATGIAQTTATLNGAIVTTGDLPISGCGFEWKANTASEYTVVNLSSTAATLTHNLTGLSANTDYTYRAFATTANGTFYGEDVNFRTLEEGVDPCDAPTNLQVTNITQNTATMTWTPGGGETSWQVGYKTQSASQWTDVPATTTSYNLEGLSANTTYNVRVRAICENNESDYVTSSFTTEGVGIDNITLANSINLQPNPADNYIELSINSNVEVKEAVIYNAFGQKIQTVELNNNHARIDLDNMAAGMYFVRVNGDNTTATKKFIKK